MSQCDIQYVRFADDWCVLAKTRWKLKTAIRTMYRVLNALKLLTHPDKTEMGRLSQGFDFLGYHFQPVPGGCELGLSATTQRRCVDKLVQLFEQGAEAKRIAEYCQRFASWARGGIEKTTVSIALNVATFGLLAKEYTHALTLLPDCLLPHVGQIPAKTANMTI